MCLEIQPAIEQDAEKHLAGVKAMTAKHACAAQSFKSGELLQGEFTEGVRAHSGSPQKQPIGRIVALVPIAVAEGVKEGLERLFIAVRHLHADQYAPVVRAVVAVVEQ